MILLSYLLLTSPLETGAPTRISVGPGDFGQQPETTPATRAMVTGRARLLVDTPNLFGTIGLDLQLRISYAFSERTWVNVNLSAIEYRQVINASIVASQTVLGPLTASAHYVLYRNEGWVITPYVRAMINTSSVFARQLGIEVGVSGSYEVHRMLTWLFGGMMPVGSTILSARATSFAWPTLVTELNFHPADWFALLAGVELRLGFDPQGPLEYVAPKFALRFYPVGGLLVELKGMLPLGGQERTDYVGGFSLGWVW